jgi:hypothetical protein
MSQLTIIRLPKEVSDRDKQFTEIESAVNAIINVLDVRFVTIVPITIDDGVGNQVKTIGVLTQHSNVPLVAG